ncbi:GntR family transcriptional regulator [Paraburkholderia sp. BCC1884]|uniref:GntR family transcriptional regulator n=1 Tax=Paraburkholderia sp. BCC1884 TaxID=2562668 RepID=UPI001183A0E6|nr:GntR family transcriptional regulator [Paraburkholderia sp. BCC1884]
MSSNPTQLPEQSDTYPVLERIRHAILDGTWAPGERLAPASLAERYDTSTTVIREGLTRLVGECLVEARTNRGFFVPELRLQEFRDLTELRCATESLALKLSLERGDLKWEGELLAAHHRMVRTPRRQIGSAHVNNEWRITHWGFHTALLAGCGCEPMLKIAASLMQSTDLYRIWTAQAPAASERNVEAEHQDLVDAALARNVDLAIDLLTGHYRATARIVAEAGLQSQSQ